ncbi:hypothetical protein [Mycobacterium sp. IDR2000157661]|uniref:hypothetical protein n=1 Tax=Mycobacterium sp. IDR2000157661 TaxID=2867005 RepID=UPI001EEC7A97|nr:hypothetical protein [Mycobacterium sp. IDR2000157661]ULE31874.1 hypothetical protein K3G64_17025 [Mycobacterium sp. IDR2000157661]
MRVGARPCAAMVTLAVTAAVCGLTQVASPAVGQAQEPVCPAGMYWDIYTLQCLPYDVNVYLNPAPVVGPAGPVGVGGVVGPVGPGPVGPGPVGPGPAGPGRR